MLRKVRPPPKNPLPRPKPSVSAILPRQKCSDFCPAGWIGCKIVQYRKCVRERYIGEGVPDARERGINASPMSASFAPFLPKQERGPPEASEITHLLQAILDSRKADKPPEIRKNLSYGPLSMADGKMCRFSRNFR